MPRPKTTCSSHARARQKHGGAVSFSELPGRVFARVSGVLMVFL